MHRPLVKVGLIVSFIVSGGGAVSAADEAPPVVTVVSRSTMGVQGEATVPGHEPSARVRVLGLSGPTWTFWIFTAGADGFCRQRVTTRVEAVAERMRPFATYSMTLPVCPRPAPGDPAPPVDDLARAFWDVRVLPDPVLSVVPDYAITGKLVYLAITGPTEQRFDVDNPIGDDVDITATSEYLVDWGDGTKATRTTSQGGPWPSGDVTHTYVDAGPTRTITVKQVWTAGWSAGSDQGTLTDLSTVATVRIPVTQVQAVRNS